MAFNILTKKQMNEKKNTKSLNDFFKRRDGKPFCFGRFGEFHIKKACSDCKYKKECYKKYEEEN